VLGNISVPKIGDAYPDDPTIRCTRKDARPLDASRLHWLVTVEYGTSDNSSGFGANTLASEDPTKLDPIIKFESAIYVLNSDVAYNIEIATSLILLDTDRKLPTRRIANSAGVHYTEGVEKIKTNTIIRISRNQKQFDPNTISTYLNTMNIKEISVAGIKIPIACGLIRELDAEKRWDSKGKVYWALNYAIEVDYDRWAIRKADRGFSERSDDLTKLVVIEDDAGNPVTEPFPLNGAGKKAVTLDANTQYVTFYPYWPMDWENLNLPKVK
jgi:hypothetical protein